MATIEPEERKAYLGKVFKFVSQYPAVGDLVIKERFETEGLRHEDTQSLLYMLLKFGFLYCPRPNIYARFLE